MTARRTTQQLLLGVLIILLAAIAVVLLTGSRHSSSAPSQPVFHSPFDGPTMPPGLRAADFTLTDQNGRRVTLSDDRGKVVVLTFIHSLCRDECPFMVEQIKGALNTLPGGGRAVPVIGVTVAPGQDSLRNRSAFLAQHEMGHRLSFLNGPLPDVRRVWHAYSIQPGTGPHGHSSYVILIDKRGFERIGFAADQLTPEGLAQDITALERS
jgi:protein SCO1/2